jgi:hypothetical protein
MQENVLNSGNFSGFDDNSRNGIVVVALLPTADAILLIGNTTCRR